MKSVRRKMKRNAKGMLSIIVITILSLSMVIPFMSVAAISAPNLDPVEPGPVEVGDVVSVSGVAGDVTSGSAVEYYWDYVAGPNAMLLNTSLGKPNGGYEAEVTVPDSASGFHYIWVKDVATGATASSGAIYVDASLELDPAAGLPGDEPGFTAYGFNDSAEIYFGIFNQTAPGVMDWWSTTNVTTSPSTVETDEYGSAMG
jgi:hypothetical protein